MIPQEFDIASVLSSNEGSIPLVHKAGVLPDLNLTLRIFEDGILNVKWTWNTDKLPSGKRRHFEVPHDIVDTSRPSKKGDALGRHITIQRNPFALNFT